MDMTQEWGFFSCVFINLQIARIEIVTFEKNSHFTIKCFYAYMRWYFMCTEKDLTSKEEHDGDRIVSEVSS